MDARTAGTRDTYDRVAADDAEKAASPTPEFLRWRDRGLLRPGGTLHLSTSLGGDEGWELVPYAPDRAPAQGQRLERWFVHHDLDPLVAALEGAGLAVERATTRTSHRRWAMVTARAV